MADLIFLNNFQGSDDPQAFSDAVVTVANAIGADPNNLMFVFNLESGVNPQAVNKTTGATGLIQWMPATAQGLGTSTAALAQMSGIEQLQYVQAYYEQVLKSHPEATSNLVNTYLSVFFPAAIGQDDSWVLQTSSLSPGIIAQENPVFDTEGNGQITVGDIAAVLQNRMPGTVFADVQAVEIFASKNIIGLVIAGVGIIGLVFVLLEAAHHKKLVGA